LLTAHRIRHCFDTAGWAYFTADKYKVTVNNFSPHRRTITRIMSRQARAPFRWQHTVSQ